MLAAVYSCFGLIGPRRHGTANKQAQIFSDCHYQHACATQLYSIFQPHPTSITLFFLLDMQNTSWAISFINRKLQNSLFRANKTQIHARDVRFHPFCPMNR